MEGRASAAETVIERLSALTSELEQDLYLKQLAQLSGIELQLLRQKLQERGPRTLRPGKKTSPPESIREDYPLPTGPNEDLSGTNRGSKDDTQVPPWSKTEQMLLCLLLYNSAARQEISSLGAQEYFYSPEAIRIAELILANLNNVDVASLETLIAKVDPREGTKIKQYLVADPEAYKGEQEAMLVGCQKALLRENKKLQREELLHQIRRAEQLGDGSRVKELMDRFTKLK